MPKTRPTPFLAPPPGALSRIRELAETWPAWLACNREGEVWLSGPGLGSSPREARMRIRDADPFLTEAIVPAVLAASPSGGRFVVDARAVVLVRTRAYVAVFGCLN